jgi:hypothetical protein
VTALRDSSAWIWPKWPLRRPALAREAVSAVMDGDLLRAWQAGELTPLERRAIVAGMVDRVILYRANQSGKKTSADIAERVQIVLKGNELLAPISALVHPNAS